ncbi:MAG: FliO/MopB family protein [Verrucomicrobia bacterium]|nr:FliO/MopB family protein [Verrucomicrobiota bacterium]
MKVGRRVGLCFLAFNSIAIAVRAAGVTGTNAPPALSAPSDNILEMLLRITGAFCLVIAIFIFGVWFFKRSRLFSLYQGGHAQLKVLETRSLGYRNTLLVIGYSQQRFLIAVSATGVNLLCPLPDAGAAEAGSIPQPQSSFSQQLNALPERKA